MKERNKKRKEARRTGNQEAKEEFKRLRNKCVEELRKDEEEFKKQWAKMLEGQTTTK